MRLTKSSASDPGAVLQKATFWLGFTAAFLLLPFAVNNFVHGRWALATGATAIVMVFLYNAISTWRTGRYSAFPTVLTLVPAIILFLVMSIRTQGIIGVLWCYPAVLTFYFLLPERFAWLANAVLLVAVVPSAWPLLGVSVGARMIATLLTLSIFSVIMLRVIRSQQRILEARVAIDPLTGVYNRTLLPETLEDAISSAARDGLPMTLVGVDLDHFKAINDSLGHAAGDSVLRGVALILRDRFEAVGDVFRTGGEEFLILLKDIPLDRAKMLADEMRREIKSSQILGDRSVTASSGVATWTPGEDVDLWMDRCDAKLYQAKQEGRNRVAA